MEGIRVAEMKLCKECGVPSLVSKGQIWHDNGTVTEAKDPDHRMLLCESDNLEALFEGIEEIIGMPIEKIIIESKRRVTKEYLEKMIPAFARKLIYLFKPTLIAQRMADIGKAYGYGDIELVEIRRHGGSADYLIMTIERPYSILFFRGDNLGGMEAASGRECKVDTEQIGEDKYRLNITVGTHPPELQERLQRKRHEAKPGDIALERCSTCGIPSDVAAYRWDLERGTITTPKMGRRMALFGPIGLETIFDDLEAELGESIPSSIIEAQRRYVRDNMGEEWLKGRENFRRMCALRGLGNITGFEYDDRHITVTVQNHCVAYLMVGIVQGLFEIATGKEKTEHSWSVAEDGDLTITVNLR
jgi:hypothetical protein